MVASVGFGKPTARSFLASTTNKCAASNVLVACKSTLCRLPSGSVTVTVHQRIVHRVPQEAKKRRNHNGGHLRSGSRRRGTQVQGRCYRWIARGARAFPPILKSFSLKMPQFLAQSD